MYDASQARPGSGEHRTPLSRQFSSRGLEETPDASRAEPYVLMLDAAAGFAAPTAPGCGGAEGASPRSTSTATTGASPALSRAHSAPFSVPMTSRSRALRPCCVLRAACCAMLPPSGA